jgi:hypothetical protein
MEEFGKNKLDLYEKENVKSISLWKISQEPAALWDNISVNYIFLNSIVFFKKFKNHFRYKNMGASVAPMETVAFAAQPDIAQTFDVLEPRSRETSTDLESPIPNIGTRPRPCNTITIEQQKKYSRRIGATVASIYGISMLIFAGITFFGSSDNARRNTIVILCLEIIFLRRIAYGTDYLANKFFERYFNVIEG